MAIWYVRPNTSHSGTRNGTSYANAWGGWSEVVWGVSGVSVGDTLYVCGAHSYAASITVGAHLAGSEPQRVTISGSAPEESGSITFTASGSVVMARAWTTLRDLTINGFNANVPLVDISANSTQNRVVRCRLVSGGNGSGVRLNATGSTTLADIRIEECGFFGTFNAGEGCVHLNATVAASVVIVDGLRVSGCTFNASARFGVRAGFQAAVDATSKIRNTVIIDNTFTRCSTAVMVFNAGGRPITNEGLLVARNDCRALPVDSAGEGGLALLTGVTSSVELGAPTVELNRCDDSTGTWGGVFFNDCTGLVIRNNYFRNIKTTATQNRGHGIAVSSAVTGAEIYGNYFEDVVGLPGVADTGAVINFRGGGASVNVYNNVAVGCRYFLRATNIGASCVVEHNTALDCRIDGINLGAGAGIANLTGRNNLLVAANASVPSVNNSSTAWTQENFNAFCGFAAPIGHTPGANSITPSTPKLTASGKPDAGSVLQGAGTTTSRTTDFLGAARSGSTPTIGAMEAESSALARDSGDTTYSGTGPQSPVVPELWQNVPMRARLKYRNHWKDSPWYAAG